MKRILGVTTLLLGLALVALSGLLTRPAAYGQGLAPAFKMLICSPGSAAEDIAREEAERGTEKARELFESYEQQLVCILMDELLLDKEGLPRIITSERALILIYSMKMWNEHWEGLKVFYIPTRARAA